MHKGACLQCHNLTVKCKYELSAKQTTHISVSPITKENLEQLVRFKCYAADYLILYLTIKSFNI